MKVTTEYTEDGKVTYAVRWVDPEFIVGMQQAALLRAQVEILDGLRMRRFNISEEEGKGKAVRCAAFVDVTDSRVAQLYELKLSARLLSPAA